MSTAEEHANLLGNIYAIAADRDRALAERDGLKRENERLVAQNNALIEALTKRRTVAHFGRHPHPTG